MNKDIQVGDIATHKVNGMVVDIIQIDASVKWYRERSSGAIASIDLENKKQWSVT
jgi:hypothetical protein